MKGSVFIQQDARDPDPLHFQKQTVCLSPQSPWFLDWMAAHFTISTNVSFFSILQCICIKNSNIFELNWRKISNILHSLRLIKFRQKYCRFLHRVVHGCATLNEQQSILLTMPCSRRRQVSKSKQTFLLCHIHFIFIFKLCTLIPCLSLKTRKNCP